MEGERCSGCGMSYGRCTDRILKKGLTACCNTCYEDDSHLARPATVERTPRRSFNEPWGFVWDGVRVMRTATIRGRKVLTVSSEEDSIEIIFSPQHKRVEIRKNGVLLEPSGSTNQPTERSQS